jgi:ArsR family transcriptional regulator, arsenate/arsenite/antimonite-responsive transcriptional repressor
MSRAAKNEKANTTTATGDEPLRDLLTTFKALSDETRLRILKLLEHGELCVCDMVAAFGMIQPKVSFHLSVLKQAGLVKDRKEGKWMHYGIDDSDLFKRLLILSVAEKIPSDPLGEDAKRLKEFLDSKAQVTPIRACCARKSK